MCNNNTFNNNYFPSNQIHNYNYLLETTDRWKNTTVI